MDSNKSFFEDDIHVKLKLDDFTYDLPEKLIAQYPLTERDQSRLMVVDRQAGTIEHHTFADLPNYINANDCVVVNNTRVFPARLIGTKDKTGAKVEVFLLRNLDNGIWEVMVKPARKVRLGNKIVFSEDFSCDIIDNTVSGGRIIETHCNGNFFEVLEKVGQTPLPPYVKRPAEDIDRESYQTIFASVRGAVAAPTAGRHFTQELVEKVRKKGASFEEITLHVGLGTFKPVQVDDISRHQMHSEYYEVSNVTAANITKTKEKGGRIITIGTTTVRALETVADRNGVVRGGKGWTDKYIFPPHQFRSVDGLVTNFHLPQSTLLMMTVAFGGLDLIMEAYQQAVKEKYRFFSYGDAMLIL